MLARPGLQLPVAILLLRPLHAEMLLIGWMVQLAFGVAYWILPRFGAGPGRGKEWSAWVSVAVLNLGVLAAGLGQSFELSGMALMGRAAEMLAAMTFGFNVWQRVGSVASRSRAEERSGRTP
jgi:hypothetical protein